MAGDPATALASPFSIVITRDLARRIFGDEEALGQQIQVTPEVFLTVTGVVNKVPENTSLTFDFLVSCTIGSSNYNKWDVKSLRTFVLLSEGSNYRQVSEKIKDVYNIHNNHINNLYLQPLKDVHHYALGGGGRYIYVVIFSLLAAGILLIAVLAVGFQAIRAALTNPIDALRHE